MNKSRKIYHQNYRQQNSLYLKQYFQDWYREWNNGKYLQVKKTARNRGIEFTITKEDFPEKIEYCPILGIKLRYDGKLGSDSASIDRIDTEKGYIPGNVQILSQKANTAKGNLTNDELLKFAEYILQNYSGNK